MAATEPALLDARTSDPVARGRLRAWLALQRAFAFEPEAIAEALRAGASPTALMRKRGRTASPADLERDLAVLARTGARVLPLGAPGYPERLARLADAPAVLTVRGDPRCLALRSVAIVGPRAPTVYGRRVARRLAAGLARAGIVVVSGLARGIDAEAHRGALEAGGYTVALQGHGPDRVYPREHRGLASEIASSGALVTELPVGTPPLAHCFPLRNRLISAMSEAVVVVEARMRSGSLVTARHAGTQGVDVFAVPGPIDAPTSEGTHALLRDGAGLVAGPEDVLGALRPPVALAPVEPAPGSAAPDGLPGRVLQALALQPLRPDDLARELGLPPETLALALVELELAGRVQLDRDGRLRRLG